MPVVMPLMKVVWVTFVISSALGEQGMANAVAGAITATA
jgi:hypothetical protein